MRCFWTRQRSYLALNSPLSRRRNLNICKKNRRKLKIESNCWIYYPTSSYGVQHPSTTASLSFFLCMPAVSGLSSPTPSSPFWAYQPLWTTWRGSTTWAVLLRTRKSCRKYAKQWIRLYKRKRNMWHLSRCSGLCARSTSTDTLTKNHSCPHNSIDYLYCYSLSELL